MKYLLFTGVLLAAACATPRAAAGDDRDAPDDQKPKQEKAEAGNTSSMQMNMQQMVENAARQAKAMQEASRACETEISETLSAEQVAELGRERTAQFLKDTNGTQLTDAAALKDLSRIGGAVAQGASNLHFGLVTSDKLRAFSASDGTVLVTTGVLKKCTNEAQLAGVLAHEVDRVVKAADQAPHVRALRSKCQAEKMVKEMMPGTNLNTAMFAGMMGGLETMMRGGEYEADAAAQKALVAAGYEPVEYETFITALGDTDLDGVTHTPDGAAHRVEKLKAARDSMIIKNHKKPPLPKSLSAL